MATSNVVVESGEQLSTSKEIFATVVEKTTAKLAKMQSKLTKLPVLMDELTFEVQNLKESYNRYIDNGGNYSQFVQAGYKNAGESAEELVYALRNLISAYDRVYDHATALTDYIAALKKESSH